jgi:DNA-binding response OmpR family regulator
MVQNNTPPHRIVCVEDEDIIMMLLRDALAPIQVEVIGAGGVDAGLAAVREHNPLLVVLDLMLPLKNGWLLVDELRADNQYADLPIIVYTSRDLVDEKLSGGRLEKVQEFITKPRSILELRDVIKKYLPD